VGEKVVGGGWRKSSPLFFLSYWLQQPVVLAVVAAAVQILQDAWGTPNNTHTISFLSK
jgi:hypothetical protein